jgi:hypothetical protein
MPVRTKIQAVRSVGVDDPLTAFTWACNDDFTTNFITTPFPSRAEAQRAWASWRRRVWAQETRFRVPRAARVFDGLTLDALDDVLFRWNHIPPFDLAPTLSALARDRAHLESFAGTKAGASIADMLDLLRADLDEIERVARVLAVTDVMDRAYPGSVLQGPTYGERLSNDNNNH